MGPMASARTMDVLVVDPDTEVLSFFHTVLAERGDRVTPLAEADRLLKVLEGGSFDLLVLSLDIPGDMGLALVHHAGALHPDLPVVVIAGSSSIESASHARALGARAILLKPLAGDDVLGAVDQIREIEVMREETRELEAARSQHRRRLSILRRGQDLLACETVEALTESLAAVLVNELSARAAGVWLAHPSSPSRLVPRGASGACGLPRGDIDCERHPSGPRILTGAPFSPAGQPGQLWIPVGGGERLLGLLVVERGPGEGQRMAPEDMALGEIMADISVAALHNIRRMEILEQSGIKDPKTSAYTFAYFADLAGREIEMSRRHDRRFSVATLSIDNYEMLAAQLEPHELSAMTSRVVEIGLDTIRDSDVLARAEDDEFCLLLPDTGNLGALTFRRRLIEAVARDAQLGAVDARVPLGVSIGVASFPGDGHDLSRLMRASRERRRVHRRSPLARLQLMDAPFWTTFDALVGDGAGYRADDGGALILDRHLARMDDPEGSLAHVLLAETDAARITDFLLREVGLRGAAAGICYLHAGLLPKRVQIKLPQGPPGGATEICVLRPSGPWPSAPHGATEIPMDDPLLEETRFLLFLGETQWYGYLGRVIGGERVAGLHFSDLALVDEMVNRLQRHYRLQRGAL
jgi:diguanylate cyclase (GGDEF)-like protein